MVKAARHHFDKASGIMEKGPRRAMRAPRIMGEVYRLILARMAARGFRAPRHPIRLGRIRILWIIARYAFI